MPPSGSPRRVENLDSNNDCDLEPVMQMWRQSFALRRMPSQRNRESTRAAMASSSCCKGLLDQLKLRELCAQMGRCEDCTPLAPMVIGFEEASNPVHLFPVDQCNTIAYLRPFIFLKKLTITEPSKPGIFVNVIKGSIHVTVKDRTLESTVHERVAESCFSIDENNPGTIHFEPAVACHSIVLVNRYYCYSHPEAIVTKGPQIVILYGYVAPKFFPSNALR